MKRQKRDKSERVFHNGFRAAQKGHSADSCPHGQNDQRALWLGGFRQAREGGGESPSLS